MSTIVQAALRASSFTIYVDLPHDAERMLLVHGYSGAYDLVSADVARYVRSLDDRPSKPLYGTWSDTLNGEPVNVPSDATIETLRRRGFLTALDREDERRTFNDFADAFHAKSSLAAPAYTIMPTYDCNLRCDYCFQDHMRTNASYAHLLKIMSRDVAERILRAMPAFDERHGIDPGSNAPRPVTFFGGEPLLKRTRPVVEYFINELRKTGRGSFSAVTNATELEAFDDLLGPEGIAALQITIDGPAQDHDRRRIYADGGGSFARIMQNIALALSRDAIVDVRMNVDRRNIVGLPALLAAFAEQGWLEHRSFSCYVAPVRSPNHVLDRKSLFNSYELRCALETMRAAHPLTAHIGLPDDDLARKIAKIVLQGAEPLLMMKASYCGAHTGMYVIDPFGDIYACWERTGDKNLRVGWIEEDAKLAFVADRLANWRSRNIASNDACGRCRYAMYCGGGCAVLAEDVHGTLHGNYCDAFARRFRETVANVVTDPERYRPGDERILDLRAL